MNPLPYDDLETLGKYLYATYKGSTEEVKSATTVLFNMSKDIARFAESLLRIVVSENTNNGISSLFFHLN